MDRRVVCAQRYVEAMVVLTNALVVVVTNDALLILRRPVCASNPPFPDQIPADVS